MINIIAIEKNNIKEMEATTIAHLTGQMVTILEMIEFSIQQTSIKDYQTKFLMELINEASAVNDEIFEMYTKSELDRIKKTYNDENK